MAQSPKFFLTNKVFVYRAVYLNNRLDTLSDEIIELRNTGEKWTLDSKQFVAEYIYHPSSDASNFLPTLNKIPLNMVEQAKEGIIDNGRELWIHPFRSNQYYLTEIAPMPKYFSDGTYIVKNKTIIGEGWGTFRGVVRNKFYKKGFENVEVGNKIYENCEKIYAVGKHRLGTSTVTFFVHNKYGFVKLHYHFFNKQQIIFSLIDSK